MGNNGFDIMIQVAFVEGYLDDLDRFQVRAIQHMWTAGNDDLEALPGGATL
jgi:hypothetical protein